MNHLDSIRAFGFLLVFLCVLFFLCVLLVVSVQFFFLVLQICMSLLTKRLVAVNGICSLLDERKKKNSHILINRWMSQTFGFRNRVAEL